jgi:hypothetical protein
MDEKNKSEKDASLMHDVKSKQNSLFSMKLLGFLLVFLVLGVGTGYVLSTVFPGGAPGLSGGSEGKISGGIEKGEKYGDGDPEIFTDEAEGTLKEGGIDGEGQYHLERPGGESQNVYLTSSVVDLSQFKGKKIKVWGSTFEGEKAGWLMDVGIVEVL